jgi:hypothetical protein
MAGVALFLLASVVGSYGTLIGAGGGFLVVPLLLFLYPAEPVTALASLSLAVVALNALSGVMAYARRGRVDYALGLRLAAVSVPGTMLGAALTALVPRGLFEILFGAVLLLLGGFLALGSAPGSGATAMGRCAARALPPRRLGLGLTLSGLVACLSGMLGIGGSPLQVVVLTHPMRVPVSLAMPTAQFTVLLSALGGLGVHLLRGSFDADPTRLVLLGAGVLVGAQLGAALAERMTHAGLVRLLALALLSVGLRLVLKPS